jgi:NADPH-dependent curcumin reductase CurA
MLPRAGSIADDAELDRESPLRPGGTPSGKPAPENFRLEEAPIPHPADGEVLLRTLTAKLTSVRSANGVERSSNATVRPES